MEVGTAALGGLDILLNNVGIAGPVGAPEAVSEVDFAGTMAVNDSGHFVVTRAGIPYLA
ncbi:hypothetical protein X753_31745 [Mesorhizobium sp. LNJC399B00]|uniref:SDR family NAD(P)-dependent oxidoreductase n=1 Tax=Mesorhizobium sp. C399B TaxID=2956833 RepID=UPI0003CDD7C4|nr:hypothetical protein X753_31745 [Mesorhizobium sp. LNJC399B00]